MAKKFKEGLKAFNAKAIYDEETKSMYIYLPKSIHSMGGRTDVAKSRQLKGVVADYNKKGELMGLEILSVDMQSRS